MKERLDSPYWQISCKQWPFDRTAGSWINLFQTYFRSEKRYANLISPKEFTRLRSWQERPELKSQSRFRVKLKDVLIINGCQYSPILNYNIFLLYTENSWKPKSRYAFFKKSPENRCWTDDGGGTRTLFLQRSSSYIVGACVVMFWMAPPGTTNLSNTVGQFQYLERSLSVHTIHGLLKCRCEI